MGVGSGHVQVQARPGGFGGSIEPPSLAVEAHQGAALELVY